MLFFASCFTWNTPNSLVFRPIQRGIRAKNPYNCVIFRAKKWFPGYSLYIYIVYIWGYE